MQAQADHVRTLRSAVAELLALQSLLPQHHCCIHVNMLAWLRLVPAPCDSAVGGTDHKFRCARCISFVGIDGQSIAVPVGHPTPQASVSPVKICVAAAAAISCCSCCAGVENPLQLCIIAVCNVIGKSKGCTVTGVCACKQLFTVAHLRHRKEQPTLSLYFMTHVPDCDCSAGGG